MDVFLVSVMTAATAAAARPYSGARGTSQHAKALNSVRRAFANGAASNDGNSGYNSG